MTNTAAVTITGLPRAWHKGLIGLLVAELDGRATVRFEGFGSVTVPVGLIQPMADPERIAALAQG